MKARLIACATAALAAAIPAAATEVERHFGDFEHVPQALRPNGVDAIGLNVLPYALAGIGYDSNIYPLRLGARDESDLFWAGAAGVSVRSQEWGPLVLRLDGIYRETSYFTEDTEDISEFDTNLHLGYAPWSGGLLYAEVGYLNDHVDRDDPDERDTVERTDYYTAIAKVGAKQDGEAYFLQLDWRFIDINYNDGDRRNWTPALGIAPFEPLVERDHEEFGWQAIAGWKSSPGMMPYVLLSATRNAYDEHAYPNQLPWTLERPLVNRSADVWRAVAGFRWDLPTGARGDVWAGYVSQDFDLAGLKDVSTFDVGGRLRQPISEPVSAVASLRRTVEETAVPGASAYIETSAKLGLDARLTDAVYLRPALSYTDRDFQAIDRDDDLIGAELQAMWYWRQWLYFGATMGFVSADSDTTNDWDRWSGLVHLNAQW